MGRSFAMLVMVAGCGRWGFQPQVAAGDGAPAPSDAMAVLACGAPTRFQVGAAGVTALAAVGSPGGYDVFTDDAGDLRGWAYAFSGDQLAATQQNLSLATQTTGALGAVSSGGAIMLSSMDGMPTATGTTIYPLDAALRATATPSMRAGQLAATSPIASSGLDGAFAFVTVDGSTGEVDAHALAANGGDAGAPVAIVDAAAVASNVSIASAPGGYVVSYASAAGSPRQVTLELLDGSFAVVKGPIAVDTAAGDEYRPVIAWGGGAFLVAWHAKNATNDDDVWIELFGPDLVALTAPQVVATFSNNAVVASDGSGFWLVWLTYQPTPTRLGGAHVALDGTVTPRSVLGTSGTPGAYTMLARGSQPVLVWTEIGGTGPDLYFDPMCAL